MAYYYRKSFCIINIIYFYFNSIYYLYINIIIKGLFHLTECLALHVDADGLLLECYRYSSYCTVNHIIGQIIGKDIPSFGYSGKRETFHDSNKSNKSNYFTKLQKVPRSRVTFFHFSFLTGLIAVPFSLIYLRNAVPAAASFLDATQLHIQKNQ